MAAPKWFDYATYKANKLAQLQQLDSSWTQTKMEAAFTNAGFTGTDGYFNPSRNMATLKTSAPTNSSVLSTTTKRKLCNSTPLRLAEALPKPL